MSLDPNKIATDSVLVHAVNVFLRAKAYHDLMVERVKPIQASVMAVWKPRATRNGRAGEIITDMDKLYQCEDSELCRDIYADLDHEYRKAGFTDLEPGHCPALIAEGFVREAGRAIVHAMQQYFPTVDPHSLLCAGLEKYHQYIDLAVRLVVNHPSYRQPTIAA